MPLATSTRRPRLGLLASAALAALVSTRAAAQIDLGDVTAGGDGSGNAPGGNIGIDPRNGAFVQVGNQNTIQETDAGSDGLNPSPATTDFVDSVFFIGPEAALDPFPQAITQSGVTFDFPLADGIGTGWNYILANQGGGGVVPILVGGVNTWTSAVGIHASQGITYDLDALRTAHGAANVGCFTAVWGVDDCGIADVNLYAILSNDDGILAQDVFPGATANSGKTVQLSVPANARYLTLACGSNGVDWCDHGTFAIAKIAAGACPASRPVESVSVVPERATLGPGGNIQLQVRGFYEGSLLFDATPASSGTTYSATPPGIVTVGADGLVTGVGNGTATVTATNGGHSDTTTIEVTDVLFLSDLVAGGDGSGTAPVGNIGIDPRNGSFVTASVGGTVRETDAQADGVNPSPVAGSEYVDSIFFIGPEAVLNPFPQAITQSGVQFEFPLADGIGTGYNYTFSNRGADGEVPLQVANRTDWSTGLGIHASTGITFDLAALRTKHGAGRVGCFSAVLGMDDCGGDVIHYVILSSEADGILETRTFRATQHSGSYVQLAIPASADYLTLAVGSNGADGCDHGNIAEPVITGGACVTPPLTAITVSPVARLLSKTQTLQLVVTGTLESGLGFDITAAAMGTTYSAAPAGIVTVSADGLVTAVANGKATITVTNGTWTATSQITIQDFIDLGNITAGGKGKGPTPLGQIGINADTGEFVMARNPVDVPEANGVNPQPVGAPSFIDSVFIIDVGVGQAINSSGASFDFDPGDVAGGWEGILNGREPGGPDFLQFAEGGPYGSGVGIHAAQGITFDLASIRTFHGDGSVKYLIAIAGEASGTAGGTVNAYMILSDATGVLDSRVALRKTDSGELIQMEIPAGAAYATLAAGAAGDGIGGDHGAFALAQISPTPVDVTNISALVASPSLSHIAQGDQVSVSLKGILAVPEFAGIPTAVDPALATFTTSDPAVAGVDAAGLVTAEGAGLAKIRATVGGLSAEVTVIVGEFINLGDVTAGGDGSGTAPVENIGIDPRNGRFVQVSTPGTIRETDVDGDGLNPSPTESDFIDSVFIIGPGAGADPFAQAISQAGVLYGFPLVDAIGTGYNFTFADRGADGAQPLQVGGLPWARGVGIHASTGITYNLEALRQAFGADAVKSFVAFWGVDGCGAADINLYAVLSNDAGILDEKVLLGALANAGAIVELAIPAEAKYLTLAVGSNGADACDHGNFAEAMILGAEIVQGKTFRRGDANADGNLNITDGIFVLNYLFLGGPTPSCLEAAEANDDGNINITDGIYILNYLFLGGPAPPSPGPDACGPDRPDTPGDVTCESYTSC